MLVVEHLLLLTATAAALLAANLLGGLPRGRFAAFLALEDELGEHAPRKPAVGLAAPPEFATTLTD